MPTNGTFRVSGVIGNTNAETNVVCVFLNTATTGVGLFALTAVGVGNEYNGSGTISLTDPSGPYEYEVRSCTATTQVSFDAPIGIRRTRGLYDGGAYFKGGKFYFWDQTTAFPAVDVEAIAGDPNAASLTASRLNVNLTGSTVRQVDVVVREVTIDSD